MDEKGRRENAGGEGLFLACKCQIKGADQGSVRHPVMWLGNNLVKIYLIL